MGGISIAIKKFLRLHDTPSSYSGQAGKYVKVNAVEDALQFAAGTAGEFLTLDDTPASYSGQAGKYPKVNVGEDALEFAAVSAGIVEGDYTTWTHKWISALPDGLSSSTYLSVSIDDKNGVFHLTWRDGATKSRFGIYNLADFSIVFESPSGSHYGSGYPQAAYGRVAQRSWNDMVDSGGSISLQTYLLLMRDGYQIMEVWRGGATPVWSHDTSDEEAGTYIGYGMISITGKWIILLNGNDKLICYEGS